MSRRHRTLAGVTIAAAGMVAALTLPAGAASAPAPPAPAPDVTTLQRDQHLTADQARALIAKEVPARGIEKKMRQSLGTRFAGTWIAPDGQSVVVATTDAARTGEIRTAGAQPKVVQKSERQLNAAKASLDRNQRSAPRTSPGWYVDIVTNSVVVLSQPAAVQAAKDFAARSGADARVVATNESPRLLFDVRGGDAYYTSQFRCSIGFSVNGGYVSAGHCGNSGESTSGFNREAQGTFGGSSFPGNDYSWVNVNSNWTPRGVVNNYSGGEVPVRGSQQAPVGAAACRSGSTSGWHCGSIQAYNQTVNYPEGTVSGLIRTNICAEPGDSGGSMISTADNQAQGITSGGSGDCSRGGTTFFQPVNEALQASGRTLVTSDGTPPPTGCEGYEETFNGTLASGANQYRTFQSTVSGTHAACLDGPNGADFDLYLQKQNSNGAWRTVATSNSPAPDEKITYNGTPGSYRYRVHAYSGSGGYVLGVNTP